VAPGLAACNGTEANRLTCDGCLHTLGRSQWQPNDSLAVKERRGVRKYHPAHGPGPDSARQAEQSPASRSCSC